MIAKFMTSIETQYTLILISTWQWQRYAVQQEINI